MVGSAPCRPSGDRPGRSLGCVLWAVGRPGVQVTVLQSLKQARWKVAQWTQRQESTKRGPEHLRSAGDNG